MKLLFILVGVIVLGLSGALVYISISDISINQSEVVETIPNERFYKD